MDATPTLEPGLALLEQPDSGALHRLVLDHEVDRRETSERASGAAASHERDGETLWVDAGGAASTYGLTAQISTRRALQGIHVARAFTAHQHHQLLRNAVARATPRTGLVVAPNVATLYDVDDATDAELGRLFAASVALLADLADAVDVPVLVSAPRASEKRRGAIADCADREIDCEATDLGYAYDAPGFDQHGYYRAGWWQTTIPYWVEVCDAGPPVGAALDDVGLPTVDAGLGPDGVPDRTRTDRTQAALGGW